jgi:chromatin remodeling complex protein RSC6
MSTSGTSASSKMARNSKTATTAVTTAPAATPAPAPATETKKVSKKAAEAAPAPAPVVEVVVDASASSVSFESVISTLETLRREVSAALTQVRELEKVSRRKLRDAASSSKKSRRQRDPNAPPRKPSGITMPVEVSAELKKFLGLGASELISRTSAAGKLTAYAREHKLFDANNGRLIKPNAALKTLLRLGESDELTIPSLQKYIGVHFPPKKTA